MKNNENEFNIYENNPLFVCKFVNCKIDKISDTPRDYRGLLEYISSKGVKFHFHYDKESNSTSIYCLGITANDFMDYRQEYYALIEYGVNPGSLKAYGVLRKINDELGSYIKSASDNKLNVRKEQPRRQGKLEKIGFKVEPVPHFVNDISQLDYNDYDVLSYLRDVKGFQFGFIVEDGTNYLYCINKSKDAYNYERIKYYMDVKPKIAEENKTHSVENAARFIFSGYSRCTPELLGRMEQYINKPLEEKSNTDELSKIIGEIDDTLGNIKIEELDSLSVLFANEFLANSDVKPPIEFLTFVLKRIEYIKSERVMKVEKTMNYILELSGKYGELISSSLNNAFNNDPVSRTVADNEADSLVDDALFAFDALCEFDKETLKMELNKKLNEKEQDINSLLISIIINKLVEREKKKNEEKKSNP